jgi:hypothetical protein
MRPARAKAKAGDTLYGKRIAFIAAEMEPLKVLFNNLQRNNGQIYGYYAKRAPKIDGDLTKPFWTERDGGVTTPLGDLTTGSIPSHLGTNVSFRWLKNEQALVVGVECVEPKMNQLRASCKDHDSYAIFSDDNVEIRCPPRAPSRTMQLEAIGKLRTQVKCHFTGRNRPTTMSSM